MSVAKGCPADVSASKIGKHGPLFLGRSQQRQRVLKSKNAIEPVEVARQRSPLIENPSRTNEASR